MAVPLKLSNISIIFCIRISWQLVIPPNTIRMSWSHILTLEGARGPPPPPIPKGYPDRNQNSENPASHQISGYPDQDCPRFYNSLATGFTHLCPSKVLQKVVAWSGISMDNLDMIVKYEGLKDRIWDMKYWVQSMDMRSTQVWVLNMKDWSTEYWIIYTEKRELFFSFWFYLLFTVYCLQARLMSETFA